MKHILFAPDALIHFWQQTDATELKALLTQIHAHNAQAWLVTSSLAPLWPDYKTDLLNLLSHVKLLSQYAHDLEPHLANIRDLSEAQLALAADSLHGDACIVTLNDHFDALERTETCSPDQALDWLQNHEHQARDSRVNTIDFIDLKGQQDRIRPQLERNLHTVLRHGRYILGPEVQALEHKLAEFVGVQHCIGVSSGTDALLVALMAYGVGPGDEVITTPFTFIATAEVITLLGAKPVYVDIDPRTYNIDVELLETAITPATRAILPVSLYGQCADMDAINAIAARHQLPVIEDACQSFGARYKGKRSCGLSKIGATSFFPSKPLGGYGDGGALFTDDDALATQLRQISAHGQGQQRYQHVRIGINGRLDSLQAAVLLPKLELLPEEITLRRQVGERYTRLIEQLPGCDDACVTPYIEPHNNSVYAQYTLRVKNRTQTLDRLKQHGIPTAVHYPMPLHQQQALANPGAQVPISEAVSSQVMSLPMHPYLTVAQQQSVVAALADATN